MKSYTSKWYQPVKVIIKYSKKIIRMVVISAFIFIMCMYIYSNYGGRIHEFMVKNPTTDTSIVAIIISIASPIISWWYRKKNKDYSNIRSNFIINHSGGLSELKISFINPSKINDYVKIKRMFFSFKNDKNVNLEDYEIFNEVEVYEYHKDDWFQWHSIKPGEITYITIISLEDSVKRSNIIQRMIDQYNSEYYQLTLNNKITKDANYRFYIEYETINNNKNIKAIWQWIGSLELYKVIHL